MTAEAGRIQVLSAEHSPLPIMVSLRLAPCGSKRAYFCRLIRRKAATLATRRSFALIFTCILLSGCYSQKGKQIPSIEFTKIPPAAQGGRERVDTIAGRVRGYR